MVGKALWQNLKVLVDIDKQISGLINEVNLANKAMADFSNQITNQKHTLDERKKIITQLKKQIDTLELQAKSLEIEENRKKATLDKIKTQKEYKSLEHEIIHLTRGKMSIENQITELWYKHEEMQNNYVSEETKLTQKLDQLTKDIVIREEAIKQNISQKELLLGLRQDATANIPAEWLVRYERMKNNVDDPIVPITNGCCSACYYSVLRQDLSKIKLAGVLPCRNCYRFLYYNDEEQKDLEQAKY